MRILVAEPKNFSAPARAVLEAAGQVDYLDLDRAGLIARLADYEALVIRLRTRIDAAVLAAGPRLRAIATPTTGLDHLDLAEAERRGVKVVSLRGEVDFLRTIPATAEHALGLILALLRRIPWAFEDVKAGGWDRDSFRGHDLAGRSLGLIGLGRVGILLAGYGLALGMKVAACDPHCQRWLAQVHRANGLAELLAQSDVVSFHVPLDRTTQGLLGRRELGWCRPGAVLVNTSRGGIIDEAALLEALAAGRLAGAALDVVEGEVEGRPSAALLNYARGHDNLLLTPHLGGATVESMAATEVFTMKKLITALEAR